MLIALSHASRIAHDHGTLPSWAVAIAVVVGLGFAIRSTFGGGR